MTIKAIETEYNGYRFRSRLEARWAVFLDILGVKYEYEPEGFDLGNGLYYLPDFRVKCYGTRGSVNERVKMDECDLCRCCKSGSKDTYAYQGGCSNHDLSWEHGYVTCAKTDADNNGQCYECDGFEIDDSYPFDLYIEVKGAMTKEDAGKIKAFGKHWEGDSEEGFPLLVVGDIPNVQDKDDLGNSNLFGSYDDIGYGIYPFNYSTIDCDYFAADPAVSDGRFFLYGDDSNYLHGGDKELILSAYKIARKARFEHGETPVVRYGR